MEIVTRFACPNCFNKRVSLWLTPIGVPPSGAKFGECLSRFGIGAAFGLNLRAVGRCARSGVLGYAKTPRPLVAGALRVGLFSD